MATKKATHKSNATATTPKVSSITKARELAKSITSAAVAANAKTPTKALATKVPATKTVAAVPTTGSFDYTQRVVANPKAAAHKGFFATVAQMAAKPITLADLITKVHAAEGSKLTSKKPSGFVVRVRVRHAFTRLGVLVPAKGK